MTRRTLKRDELVAALVSAWNNVDHDAKRDLLLSDPNLYSACSWLAAYETVRTEDRRA